MSLFINYYEVLGVSESASQREITKAYRTMAMRWHPDRYKGKDATEKMAEINEAYCILKDPEARQKYDQELRYFRQFERDCLSEQDDSHNSEPRKEYSFNDKTLEEWIRQARKKGMEVAIQTMKEIGAMSATGVKEFSYGFFWSLIAYFALGIGISALLLTCSH